MTNGADGGEGVSSAIESFDVLLGGDFRIDIAPQTMDPIDRVIQGYKKLRNLVKLVVIFWVVSFVMVVICWACGVLANNTILTPSEPLKYEVIEIFSL